MLLFICFSPLRGLKMGFYTLDALTITQPSASRLKKLICYHTQLNKMYLSLNSIGSQKNSGFWWAVNVSIQDGLFHLEKEQPLCYLLNYFRNILWKKLHQQ